LFALYLQIDTSAAVARSSSSEDKSPFPTSQGFVVAGAVVWPLDQRLVADEPQGKADQTGAKIVNHGRYVAFQMAEVAIPKTLFADILRLIAELRPPPVISTA
jgi:hypothetical protein